MHTHEIEEEPVPAIKAEVIIDAPAATVWEAIADFPNIYRFNPSVPASRSTSESPNGLGATRHCDLVVPGSSIEERIVDWVDGESYTVEIYDGKLQPPTANNLGTVAVRPDGADRSIASFALSYEPKGLMGKVVDGPLRVQFEKAGSRMLAGLKHYIETGEEIAKGVDYDKSSPVLVS